MALTYDQISGITQKKFIPKLYDNVFLGNPLLKKMKEKSYKKIDGGTSILVPLEYAETSASAWYSGAQTLDTTDNDVFTAAEYGWKQLYANISISGIDKYKNMGDSQIIDFVKSKVKNAEKVMAKKLSVGIYSDGTSDPLSIAGLRSIVSASNTVGGISQSTNSFWRAQVDSSTTTLNLAAVQTLFNAASEDSDQPNFIVSTKANFNRFWSLLQPQQRFVDKDSASAGFSSLMFNGVPWVSDTNAPANYIYLLNLNYLHLFVHSKRDMEFVPFSSPVNQDVELAKVYWLGAMGASNNRFQAVMSAVTA